MVCELLEAFHIKARGPSHIGDMDVIWCNAQWKFSVC